MAALWKLPLLLVCENNGWSEFSPTERQFRGTLEGLAKAFGINHRRVDGNDLEATVAAADEAVAYARTAGPFILECMTSRVRGHYEGDAQKYRDSAELQGLGAKDPIARCAGRLAGLGVGEDELGEMSTFVEAAVAAAVKAARDDALPDFDAAFADVYTRGELR
jgi:pyruvate dehydrogenase E1 component alpha subunit